MNAIELRKLNKEELQTKYKDSLKEFSKIKFGLKSGNILPENINRIRILKKEIARISTILNELELVKNS